MRRRVVFQALLLLLTVSVGHAQVAPTPAEVGAYEGLHRAAALGDMDLLEAELARGADVDARDPDRRTPLHVAAFFK